MGKLMTRAPSLIMFRNLLFLSLGTILFMFVLAGFSAVSIQNRAPDVDQMTRLFDVIAFSGFGEGGPAGQGPVLRRWAVPVTLGVLGKPVNRDDDERPWGMALRDYIALWNSLRGLSVTLVDLPETADLHGLLDGRAVPGVALRILVLPEEILANLASDGAIPRSNAAELADRRRGCTLLGANTPALDNVVFLVRDDLGRAARSACLGQGLAMALGFGIDARTVSDVFRSHPDGLRFLPVGRIAAELVYDAALTPGQGRDEVLPLIPGLLEKRGMAHNE